MSTMPSVHPNVKDIAGIAYFLFVKGKGAGSSCVSIHVCRLGGRLRQKEGAKEEEVGDRTEKKKKRSH